jgi:PAB1-binding protein PBP1
MIIPFFQSKKNILELKNRKYKDLRKSEMSQAPIQESKENPQQDLKDSDLKMIMPL